MFSSNFFKKYNRIDVTLQPENQVASGSVTFTTEAKSSLGNPVSYQWQKGVDDVQAWGQSSLSLPSFASLRGVSYGGGRFLVVGGQFSAVSEDGSGWAAGSMPSDANWGVSGVAYGNGFFLTAGPDQRPSFNGRYVTAKSSDGVSWTKTSLPGTDTYYSCLAFLDGVFFAGNYGTFTGTSIYRTVDGVSWTKAQTLEVVEGVPLYSTLNGFAIGNGVHVAVGGVRGTFSAGGFCSSSTDGGVTWTDRAASGNLQTDASWTGVAFGRGKFVVVSNGYGNPVADSSVAATSSDGVNWTPCSLPSAAKWIGVKYLHGMFVCVAEDRAAVSEDGVNWTPVGLPVSGSKWIGVEYGNGTFVAAAEGQAGMMGQTGSAKIAASPAVYSNVAGASSSSLNLTGPSAAERGPYRAMISSFGAKSVVSLAADIDDPPVPI